MKKARIVIYDEVNIQVQNIDFYTTRMLVEKFSFRSPGYFYRVKYTRRFVNADVSFFLRNGRSYLNLVDGIVETLTERGYEIVFEDHRKTYQFEFEKVDEEFLAKKGHEWKYNEGLIGQKILLRDYQVDIINTFLENLQCVQEAATGCGKTLIIATLAMMAEKYGRTVIIVPSKNLVTQTARYLHELKLNYGVFYQEKKEVDKQHIITTWQSLATIKRSKRRNSEYAEYYEKLRNGIIAVIVDECHTSRSHVLRDILCNMYSNVPIRWGLTATVPSEDAEYHSILVSIGRVVNSIDASVLQNKGVLSSCDIHVFQLEDTGEYGSFSEEKKALMTYPEKISFLANLVEEIRKDGNTLVLADYVKTVKMLSRKIQDSFLVYGQIDNMTRQNIYDYVKHENNKIIVATYGVAAVGIDIPRLFNVILLEPGKSAIRVIQSIGRGMRKADDKQHLVVYDICSTLKYSDRHMKQRIKIYKKAKYPYTINRIRWK